MLFRRQLSCYSNTTWTVVRNLIVLSSTTDKINRINNDFWHRWIHEYIVNLCETQRASKLNINIKKRLCCVSLWRKCAQTLLEKWHSNMGIKQSVIKQSPTFLSFPFLIDGCIRVFFSSLIKAFVNFEKLLRYHWQAFIVYKNKENLKILIEIFCQKLMVSNVVLVFLDHVKPKTFFFGQPWWQT